MKIAVAGSNIQKLLTKERKKKNQAYAGVGRQGICNHGSLK